MKKIGLLISFAILGGIIQLSAQNPVPFPIPSYNILVYSFANFQEQGGNPFTIIFEKGKRNMVVLVKGSSSSMATIWVYSLDGQDRLGPYYVYGGETVSVPIDDREWGVTVRCDDPIEVNVWIEEGGKGELRE